MSNSVALEIDGHAAALLAWQSAMGVDVTFGKATESYTKSQVGRATVATLPTHRASPSAQNEAAELDLRSSAPGVIAARCSSMQELEAALLAFDGCALKRTASHLCFGDGNPDARIMLIGEAPGAHEDRQGKPFVGPSGQLLDMMLSSIGLSRKEVWITNLIFWRPPGNRTPTSDEIAACQPFLERQIELIGPDIVLFVGGTAAKALMSVKEGVMKLRGRQGQWPLPGGRSAQTLVTFHPAFLLRQPMQKKLAWRDMLTLRAMIDQAGLLPRSEP